MVYHCGTQTVRESLVMLTHPLRFDTDIITAPLPAYDKTIVAGQGAGKTFHLDDNQMMIAYKNRLQQYCDYFNEHFLPLIVRSYETHAKNVQREKMAASIMRAIESRDYSALEIHADYFSYKTMRRRNTIGAFHYYKPIKGRAIKHDSVKSILECYDQKHQSYSFHIGMHFYRADFQCHMEDIIAHELSHAIIAIYYEHIYNSLLFSKGIPPRKILPHGKEWKAVASVLGATPSANNSQAKLTKEDIFAIDEYYESTIAINGKPKARRNLKRFIYTCGCNSFEFSSQRHNKIMREERSYRCKKCKNTTEFTGRQITVKS